MAVPGWGRCGRPRFQSEPFQAVTKHADIVAIGKNPKDWIIQPRLAVFTREVPPEPTTRHLPTLDPPEHGVRVRSSFVGAIKRAPMRWKLRAAN